MSAMRNLAKTKMVSLRNKANELTREVRHVRLDSMSLHERQNISNFTLRQEILKNCVSVYIYIYER